MTPLRVVLDTNVFHPDSFELLENSSFLRHCASGRIVPIYGHVFVEEMLSAYGRGSRRADLKYRWLPFVLASAKTFCNDFDVLWNDELVRGRGRKAQVFMPPTHFKHLVSGIENMPLHDHWDVWTETIDERDTAKEKKVRQVALGMELRRDLARRMKDRGVKFSQVSLLFPQFRQHNLDDTGRQFIRRSFQHHKGEAIAERWSRDKTAYPFFTQAMENLLYPAYCAMLQPNGTLDRNAQADLDVMTHLLHADVVVSNEQDFLRRAFEDIWRPRGKTLFTTDQFVTLIAKL